MKLNFVPDAIIAYSYTKDHKNTVNNFRNLGKLSDINLH